MCNFKNIRMKTPQNFESYNCFQRKDSDEGLTLETLYGGLLTSSTYYVLSPPIQNCSFFKNLHPLFISSL